MDIESILSSLGLDLTNPEVKKGAIEAIDAILDSRRSAGNGSQGGGGMNQEIEIDPDLLQPSVKNPTPGGPDDDVEIEDEDDVLKDLKFNDPDEPQEPKDPQNTPMSDKNKSDDSDDRKDKDKNTEKTDFDGDTEKDDPDNDDQAKGDEPKDSKTKANDNKDNPAEPDKVDTPTEPDSPEEPDEPQEPDELAKQSPEDPDREPGDEPGENKVKMDDYEFEDDDSNTDYGDDDDDDSLEPDTDGSTGANGDQDKEDSDDEQPEDDLDIDETDLLDDTLKDPYEDQAEKAKQEARKIKRERTLQAAKKTLEDAKTKNKSPALIRELEKAIDALESLQEAVAKNLKDISDEEFNLMVNRVFDAIDALGDSGLTYTTDEERQVKAKEIKADLDDRQTQAELSAEDAARIRAETQAVKAREKENAKYQRRSRDSFKGFQDFLNSLYRAVALQVSTEETRDDTWSAINRRYGGTGILQPGKKFNDLPNKKIPIIDFYFDQSGSWEEDDIRVGERAVAALAEMEEKGQIKINIYYFSNHVFSDAQSARNEGGTLAWNDIVRNVIATNATNVIIMTDSDMESHWSYDGYWNGDEGRPAAFTVPGYVWYLWRDGANAPRLPRDLKGRGGTQQFSFSSGDV